MDCSPRTPEIGEGVPETLTGSEVDISLRSASFMSIAALTPEKPLPPWLKQHAYVVAWVRL